MTADDPLESLRLTHSQWSNRYLDQIEPDDYPGLLATMADAIAAWEEERAERSGDAEGFAQKVDELTALRSEVLAVAEEMAKWCDGKTTHHDWCGCQIAARLRKAAE